MIKIAICDDEEVFLNTLERMIRNYEKTIKEKLLIKRYTKPLYLMDSLAEDFQVFFLDMQMPNIDGFELARVIRKYDEKSTIIFVTSHREYGLGCFEFEPANYIIKPITQIQVDCELNRVIRKINSGEREYIGVKSNAGFMKLFLSDIQYIETVDRNVVFHTVSKGDVIGRFKMQDLEVRLEKYAFYRCHNGVIVNLDYVDYVQEFMIVLVSGEKIYTTKSRKKELIKKLAERTGSA